MRGIQPEGQCPICQGRFKYDQEKQYFKCPEHLTTPQRFSIQIYHNGERIRRGTNLEGKPLRSLADAVELAKAILADVEKEQFTSTKWRSRRGIDFRCNKYIWQWFKEKENTAPSMQRTFKTYINYYMLPFLGNRDINKVVSLKPFYRALSELSPQKKDLSEKFKKNVVDAAYNFFRWAKEYFWETWQINLELPARPKLNIAEYEPQTVTRETQTQFLEIVDDDHKPIFTFLIYQGARPGEVRALKGDSIQGDTVIYRRTFSDNILVERTKNKKIRPNYLFSEVRDVLPKTFSEQFVFRYNNNPYHKDFLSQLYRKYLSRFNEKYGTDLNLPLYEFTKHSFGTQFINAHPEHEKLLQEHFGHGSAAMTKRYARLKVVDAFRNLDNVTAMNNRKVNI